MKLNLSHCLKLIKNNIFNNNKLMKDLHFNNLVCREKDVNEF